MDKPSERHLLLRYLQRRTHQTEWHGDQAIPVHGAAHVVVLERQVFTRNKRSLSGPASGSRLLIYEFSEEAIRHREIEAAIESALQALAGIAIERPDLASVVVVRFASELPAVPPPAIAPAMQAKSARGTNRLACQRALHQTGTVGDSRSRERIDGLSGRMGTASEPLVRLSDFAQIRVAARLCGVSQKALQRAIARGKISKHFLAGNTPVVEVAQCVKYWADGGPKAGRPRLHALHQVDRH